MTSRTVLAAVAAFLLLASGAFAGDMINGLPLHVAKPSDNAIRLWVGDYISSTAVTALNTDKGIVVIDATECPTLDEHFRAVIAREFDRDDFVYLINTHEHPDHTTGNGVYSDCEVIAHDSCAEGMARRAADSQRRIDWRRTRVSEVERELAEAAKGSDEYKRIKEAAIINEMVLESLESGLELTVPTKTFSESMTLDLGNMTLELYSMGGTHTASDIFIFVPEEGLLFTGDMMADEWFTDTPGCLQAFSMQSGVERDVPLLLEHWRGLMARKDEIKDFIPGHWNGDLTFDGFVDRYDYVETLYAGIGQAASEGKKLSDVFSEFDLATRFPDLVDTPGFTRQFVHNGNVVALWSDATGQVSACDALAASIEEKSTKAAVAEIVADRESESGKYYFLEAEFNALGYRYLGEERYEQAIGVFEANVGMYPDSWNVYDSLGEAFMKSGQTKRAIRNYEMSMELNPDNENGEQMLEQLRGVVAGS